MPDGSPPIRASRRRAVIILNVLLMTARASFDAVRLDGARYPINQMSDGEKSALILASEILTAQPGTIYLLDEPERHMHRSISASLITSATGERPDCFFVLLTHDLDRIPEITHETRRARAADRSRVLALDARAFRPFWRLDIEAMNHAVEATP